MDPDTLKIFAQVAGIGGIALGVFLLLFRDVIQKLALPILGKTQAYRLLRLVLVLIWSIAIVGIAAWIFRPAPASACAPVLDEHGKIALNCALTVAQAKSTAASTLEDIIDKLSLVRSEKNMRLFPLIDAYLEAPSPGAWEAVQTEAAGLLQLVHDASAAIVKFDAGIFSGTTKLDKLKDPDGVRTLLTEIQTRSLARRTIAVTEIGSTKTPTREQVESWSRNLRQLVDILVDELRRLKGQLRSQA